MRKNMLIVLLIIVLTISLVGCGNNNSNDNSSNIEQKNAEKEKIENKGTTMIDDNIITIIYYEKTIKEKYPSVRFNVKNNSRSMIRIEPLGIINNMEMTGRFIISNSDGKWASPYIEFKPGESYDVYFGYMDNYSKQQLDFEKFVNMDLSFSVSLKDESGGWPHIKDYKVHID